MGDATVDCVLLADRHRDLSEGVRGLLHSMCEGVFAVADKDSLFDFAAMMQPQLVVADLSLADGDIAAFLRALKLTAPAAKVLLLSVHDEPTIVTAVMAAGADGVVLKRTIASDLVEAVEAVLAGQCYSSSGFARQRPVRVPPEGGVHDLVGTHSSSPSPTPRHERR